MADPPQTRVRDAGASRRHHGAKRQDCPVRSGGGKRRKKDPTAAASSFARLNVDTEMAASATAPGGSNGTDGSGRTSVTPSPLPQPCTPKATVGRVGAKAKMALSDALRASASSESTRKRSSRNGREKGGKKPERAIAVPEGVTDLDAHRHASCRVRSHSDALEASFLSSYGRSYYRHLFEADRSSSRRRRGDAAPASAAKSRAPETPTERSPEESPPPRGKTPPYLSDQPHIAPSMRGVLVDWLIELTHTFRLSAGTLHLAVRLVDRTLRCCASNREGVWAVERKSFQCLGCACLLIASKIEETQPITTKDLAYMSDNTYTRSQIREAELRVCRALHFRLYAVTSHHFVDRFIRASDTCAGLPPKGNGEGAASPHNSALESMVSYLLELSLLLPELSPEAGEDVRASRTAAAAVYLARATLGVRDFRGEIWNDTMRHYTGFDVSDLEGTVLALHKCQTESESSELKCAFEQYSKSEQQRVALKPALWKQDLGFVP